MTITRSEFLGLMTKLHIAYRQRNDPSRLEVYWQALQDCTRDALTAAVDAQIRGSARFPRVSELRDSIVRLRKGGAEAPPCVREEPPADPVHAAAAWAVIQRIIPEHMGPHARLAAFKDMQARFPGCGWDEAVAETEKLVAVADYRAQKAAEQDAVEW